MVGGRTPTIEDRMAALDARMTTISGRAEGPHTTCTSQIEITIHYRRTRRQLFRIVVPSMPESSLRIIANRYRREVAELWTANP